VLLLRHASAGERLSTPSLDRARGLDEIGRAQARRLAQELSGRGVERIVSSPLVRCVETVEELAAMRGIAVELREELLPGATQQEILALLGELPSASVASTHREVFERLFGDEATCEKGGAWMLERDGGVWCPLAYLPPSAIPLEAVHRAALV
jgi:8-oxo-dGTP diphosphatase